MLKQSALLADEARLTNGPLMTAIKRAIATLPNEQVEAIVPNRSANPANVRRVERLMSSADWDYLFPLRAPEYTYGGFLRAIGKPAFVTKDFVKPGAVVIDVGINSVTSAEEAKRIFAAFPERLQVFNKKGSVLVGDVHPEVAAVAGALTPVPGGVGPLTIAMLMANTVRAAELRSR